MYTDVSTTFPKKMFQPCIVILVSKVVKKWSVLSTRRIKQHPPLNPQSHPRNASNSLSTDHVRQRNPLGGEECVDRLCGSVVVTRKTKPKKTQEFLVSVPSPKSEHAIRFERCFKRSKTQPRAIAWTLTRQHYTSTPLHDDDKTIGRPTPFENVLAVFVRFEVHATHDLPYVFGTQRGKHSQRRNGLFFLVFLFLFLLGLVLCRGVAFGFAATRVHRQSTPSGFGTKRGSDGSFRLLSIQNKTKIHTSVAEKWNAIEK